MTLQNVQTRILWQCFTDVCTWCIPVQLYSELRSVGEGGSLKSYVWVIYCITNKRVSVSKVTMMFSQGGLLSLADWLIAHLYCAFWTDWKVYTETSYTHMRNLIWFLPALVFTHYCTYTKISSWCFLLVLLGYIFHLSEDLFTLELIILSIYPTCCLSFQICDHNRPFLIERKNKAVVLFQNPCPC